MSEKKSLSARVVEWTRDWFGRNDRKTAVIGISGGKDSAVVAGICTEALGAGHVVGVMMPNGEQADIGDSRTVVSELGIRYGMADIKPAYDAILDCVEQVLGVPISENARVNVAPRLRMTLLYAVTQTLSDREQAKACVVGTGNKAEAMVGYTTKGGDNLSDMNPIGNLWVDEVLQVGDELGRYPGVIHKAPADGLCGKTDEERLGFTYGQVRQAFDGRRDEVPMPVLRKILARFDGSAHKRSPIPSFPND